MGETSVLGEVRVSGEGRSSTVVGEASLFRFQEASRLVSIHFPRDPAIWFRECGDVPGKNVGMKNMNHQNMSHILDSRKEECLKRIRGILTSTATLVEGLLRVIITYSQESFPRRAILEWKYYQTSSSISCICGQPERCYIIVNKITGNILHLGASCLGRLNSKGWLPLRERDQPTFYYQIIQLKKQRLYLRRHILSNKPLQYAFCLGCCRHRVPIHLKHNELCEDCRAVGAPLQDVPLLNSRMIAPQLLPVPSPSRIGLTAPKGKRMPLPGGSPVPLERDIPVPLSGRGSVSPGGASVSLPETKRREFGDAVLSALRAPESLQECVLYNKWPLYTASQSVFKPHPALPSWEEKSPSKRALDCLDDDLRPVPRGHPPYRCRRCHEEKVVPEEYGHCWRCCKMSCLWNGITTDPHWIEMNQHHCRVSAALSYIDPFGPPPQWGNHRCELCLGHLLHSDPLWMTVCRACVERVAEAISNKIPPPPPPLSPPNDAGSLLSSGSRKRARIDYSPEECDDFFA